LVSDKIIEIYKDRFLIKKTGVREKESMEIYSPRIDETGLQNAGVSIMLERISATLSSMYVRFDEWFSESSLHNGNNLKKTLKILKEKNLTYEKEGALWFKASDFGDEKDRVMIRSGGEPTYFASDVMYLLNKISRRFEKIIYILGADHHGYVKRLQAIARSAGLESGQVKVIIGQLVRLIKKGQVVRMSKRRGKVYSLDDLIKEVGSDAIRYFFSANSFDTPMDFDIGLARQKSNKNPVYYVQYAHARIANVIGKVAELYLNKKLKYDGSSINFGCFDSYASASGTNGDGYFRMEDLNFEKLEKIEENFIKSNDFKNVEIKNNDEAGLARHLILFPDVLMDACSNDAPYMINQYIYKLASQFHYFYRHNRIMDQEKINAARFKLVFLVRIVLSSAMKLLKISAPVKM
jgi:arginyl-tRNA synthetase